jgi:hypothetical protein
MSCQRCEDTPNEYWYRMGGANVAIVGCDIHGAAVIRALNYLTADRRAAAIQEQIDGTPMTRGESRFAKVLDTDAESTIVRYLSGEVVEVFPVEWGVLFELVIAVENLPHPS